MKILKESKEKLPVSFITDRVSQAWDKVGILKEEIKTIKAEFKDTKEVEDCVQELIDAHLIFIGKMESLLADKKYIQYPETEEAEELAKDALKESVHVTVETVDDDKDDIVIHKEESTEVETLPAEESEIEKEDEEEIEESCKKEACDFFCDFDEPDLSEPALTDKELYPER